MTDVGPFDACDHAAQAWVQQGRCVYCGGCDIRLFQGSIPRNKEPDTEWKREMLTVLGIASTMVEGEGVAGPSTELVVAPEQETPAAAAPSSSPTQSEAYQRGIQAAQAEIANTRQPLLTGALDPYGVRQGDLRLMRQSMINQADVCNLRVAYDINYGGGSSIERIIGTGYHAGAAKFYETLGTATPQQLHDETFNSIDRELAIAEAKGVELVWEKVANAIEARDLALHLVNLYVAHYCWDLGDYEVIAVEIPWYWPLSDSWAAHGSIDLVLRDKRSGVFVLVDHKTAGKPWKKGKESARATVQPAWYQAFWPSLFEAVCALEEFNGGTRFAFDIMTYDGKFERRWADRNAAEIQRSMDKATVLATLIDNNGPWWPNQSHFLCDQRWCDHWDRCPYGAGVSTVVDPSPVFIDVSKKEQQQ